MKVAAQSGLSVCCMCQVLRSDVSRLLDRQGQHDREDLKQVSICKESAVCQRNESGKICTSHASAARTPSPICLGIFGVRPTTFDHCLLHSHDTNDVGFVRFLFGPTVQLVVDHVLQPLQPLENGLPVHQVGNFSIPGAQPLVGNAAELDELLRAVLDPAVHREQDDAHEHQDVDGQQSFDFACHSHVKDGLLSG